MIQITKSSNVTAKEKMKIEEGHSGAKFMLSVFEFVTFCFWKFLPKGFCHLIRKADHTKQHDGKDSTGDGKSQYDLSHIS